MQLYRQGQWHYIALSAVFSFLLLHSHQGIFLYLLFLAWLLYLYFKKALLVSQIWLVIAFSIFFYHYFPTYDDPLIYEEALARKTQVEGTIISPINYSDQKISFSLKTKDKEKILVTYFLPDELKEKSSPFFLPERANCIVTGRRQLPKEATNPYQFDYRKYLYNQGIYSELIVQDREELICKPSSSLLAKVYQIRASFIHKAEENLHPSIAKWQQALLFGHTDSLETSVKELFQRWGLSHLLAISGLHVGIFLAILYFAFIRTFQMTREKAQCLIFLLLPFYAVIAGGEPSVWRASLMTMLLLLFSFKHGSLHRLDLLSIVFIALLLIDKHLIFHIGFQFSFLVTFGLILSAQWFQQSHSKFQLALKISFIAQMMIVPLQMYYFYYFQPLGMIVNLLIVPYFSFIVIPTMFASLLLYFLPSLVQKVFESLFLWLHQFVLFMLEQLDRYFSLPFMSGEINLLLASIYYFCLIGMMVYLEKEGLKQAFYYGIGLTLLLTFIIVEPYLSKEGSVTMLDIGQGDAIVLELPYRKGVFFIDAGATIDFTDNEPKDTVYRSVIKPYLMGRGIEEIDSVFISHAHLDHHGSVRYLVEDFSVGEIIVHPFFADEIELGHWNERDVPVRSLAAGQSLTRKGQRFYALSPDKDTGDENDNSLVLYSEIGPLASLFTGDISTARERQLIQAYPNIKLDLLKVAHHGSNTSTDEELLKTYRPNLALIGVGKNNRYGHPAKEVLERLDAYDVEIYRTDQAGAIQFFYRGDQLFLRTFK